MNNNHTEHRRLQGVFRTKADQDRETYLESLSQRIENDFTHNSLKSAYKVIQELRPKSNTSARPTTIKKTDGSPCSTDQETLDRWKEHYEAALNHPEAPPCPALDLLANNPPDPDVSSDAPTLEEVKAAINSVADSPSLPSFRGRRRTLNYLRAGSRDER